MTPRYSVLLPTHNRADVVGYAIQSVLRQTDPDFELLIVGDGCTDDTASVVNSFDDRRIRWFDFPKAPDFGYANRNRALREARGDLVAFMAHDDLVLPDHLETLGGLFADRSIEWGYSMPAWVSDDGVVVPYPVDIRKPRDLTTFLEGHNLLPASCAMYRRGCHERYGWWPEETSGSGDWDLWKRIVGPSRGANLAYTPIATALHFRANWRSERDWGPPPLQMWMDAAHAGWWPASLRIPVPVGSTPQAAVSLLIGQDPSGTSVSIRDGVVAAVAELAWRTSLDSLAEREVAAWQIQAATQAASESSAHSDDLERRLADALGRLGHAEAETQVERARAEAASAAATASADAERELERRFADAAARAAAAADRAAAAESDLDVLWSLIAPRGGVRLRAKLLLHRLRLAVRGNPLFDAEWYVARYPDVGRARAYRHWRTTGVRERRNPNELFDTAWYLERNADVASGGMNPLDHYYLHGGREGRAPSPEFDGRWYLSTNADVFTAGVNPLLHYLTHGRDEKRGRRQVGSDR